MMKLLARLRTTEKPPEPLPVIVESLLAAGQAEDGIRQPQSGQSQFPVVNSEPEPATKISEMESALIQEPHTDVCALPKAVSRTEALEELETEVAALLPVVPILNAQLAETSREIEESVVSVCRSFGGMTARARESVAAASSLLGPSGQAADQAGVGGLIHTSRVTLESMLERIINSSELSIKTVDRMESANQGMQRIVKALREVKEIVIVTKIMALNAKIETARLGDEGRGFDVIATELTRFAAKSAEVAETIEEVVKQVSSDVHSAVTELRALASADLVEAQQGRQEVERALNSFSQTHQEMQQSLAASAKQSEQLAQEISGAVVAFQFQDRVSQRLAHVVEALESFELALTARLSVTADGRSASAKVRQAEVLSHLTSTYTMASERAVLSGEPSDSSNAEASAAGSVELF